ncbi:host-nuclease inhibitor Gam family protein [Wielerella bovis]|uniref:host-nuclease inhibitor Gam family protein n=1 Tax=Wielerella bovis TaxID=2917790 RepID=UPI0020199AE3|nr:host-nuclease inhibitor Gam family protein [Wielerella bovis]ULJ61037.1 host-nuclease inhibitor Gam family protein [Wielerella bovis]
MSKPKKTRVKTSAQIAAQNKDEAIVFIREIGDIMREVKRLETNMNDGIAELQEKYAEQSAPLNARISELSSAVQLWGEANRNELTDNGRVKFADLVTGIIKWRNDPPKVSVTGVQAVLALLRNDPELERFIRVKEEINKEAILNERDKFDKGQVAGLKIVDGKEQFVIEPHDQQLAQV